MTRISSTKAAGLLASLGLYGLLAATARAEEAPQYQIERCCEICPQALQDSTYNGELREVSKLVQGKDDWLFRSRIDLMMEMGATAEGYESLRALRGALQEMGVELVLVYLPARGIPNANMLSDKVSGFDFKLARERYKGVLEKTRSLGIRTPDLTPLLDQHGAPGKPFFFKRDHHWTPYGAEFTARLVADELRKSQVFNDIPHKEFVTHSEGVLNKAGSLNVAFQKICGYSYANQYVPRFITEPKDESSDLFGDEAVPEVVLLGTSFSTAQYNFDGFLKQYASVDVDNRSVSGGGFHNAMLQYLGSEEFRQKPPKMLIWEITSYHDLSMPLFYRQIMPLLDNGCRGRPASMTQKMALHPGRNEVLVNTSVKPLRGERYIADLQFNTTEVRELRSELWYMNGAKESLIITRPRQTDPNGRFVFHLRNDADWGEQTLLSLEIEMPADTPAGMQVEASICPRRDNAGAALQARAD